MGWIVGWVGLGLFRKGKQDTLTEDGDTVATDLNGLNKVTFADFLGKGSSL